MSIYRCLDCDYFSKQFGDVSEYSDDRCLFHKCVVEKPTVTWCVDFKPKVKKDV